MDQADVPAGAGVEKVTVPLAQWQALNAFSFGILARWYEHGAGLDPSEIEDLGVEHGLVIDHIVSENDCAEWRDYGVGETIQRVAPWLHDINCNCFARVTAEPSQSGTESVA